MGVAGVAGADMVIVAEAPFTDCDKVMLFPPARMSWTWAPLATPEVPAVLPRLLMPTVCEPAAPAPAEIVTVADAPLTLWLRVTLLPPARMSCTCPPEATPLVPEVL